MRNWMYFAALAAIGSACSNNEMMDSAPPPAPSAIALNGSFVNNQTRSALETADLVKFAVWAWQRDATVTPTVSKPVFHQEVVKKNIATGVWTYANTQYWIPNRRYTFFALASTQDDVSTLSFQRPSAVMTWSNISFTYIMSSTRAFDDDLVYATRLIVTDADVNQQPEVDLTFNHVLSQLAFTISDGTPDGHSVAISNITYEGNQQGTCTLLSDQPVTAPAVEWSSPSSTLNMTPRHYTLTRDNLTDGKLWTTYEVAAGTKPAIPIFVIPMKGTTSPGWNGRIAFTAQLYNNNDRTGDPIMTKQLQGNIYSNFEAGHSYHVQMSIGMADMTSDKPIQFTVVEVNPFGAWEGVTITPGS